MPKYTDEDTKKVVDNIKDWQLQYLDLGIIKSVLFKLPEYKNISYYNDEQMICTQKMFSEDELSNPNNYIKKSMEDELKSDWFKYMQRSNDLEKCKDEIMETNSEFDVRHDLIEITSNKHPVKFKVLDTNEKKAILANVIAYLNRYDIMNRNRYLDENSKIYDGFVFKQSLEANNGFQDSNHNHDQYDFAIINNPANEIGYALCFSKDVYVTYGENRLSMPHFWDETSFSDIISIKFYERPITFCQFQLLISCYGNDFVVNFNENLYQQALEFINSNQQLSAKLKI